jgi:hypothetical protein
VSRSGFPTRNTRDESGRWQLCSTPFNSRDHQWSQEATRMTPVTRKGLCQIVTRDSEATSDVSSSCTLFHWKFHSVFKLVCPVLSIAFVIEVQYWDWISHLLFPSMLQELMRGLDCMPVPSPVIIMFSAATEKSSAFIFCSYCV